MLLFYTRYLKNYIKYVGVDSAEVSPISCHILATQNVQLVLALCAECIWCGRPRRIHHSWEVIPLVIDEVA
uniref:Uncharacterized protein n=1 Tax=Physcomitrium patens TaxID=3218 RepID=A0A2K1KKU0_PHYPA|nr:hypothetical protein PHYPA_008075 [Physcomitrium patens]